MRLKGRSICYWRKRKLRSYLVFPYLDASRLTRLLLFKKQKLRQYFAPECEREKQFLLVATREMFMRSALNGLCFFAVFIKVSLDIKRTWNTRHIWNNISAECGNRIMFIPKSIRQRSRVPMHRPSFIIDDLRKNTFFHVIGMAKYGFAFEHVQLRD